MKWTRSATATPAPHSPRTRRGLTDLTQRQQFDALLEAEHFLGSRFPAGDRRYQVAEPDGQWVGLLLWCAPALHHKPPRSSLKKRAAARPWASKTTSPPAAEHPTETGRRHPPFAQTEPSRGRIETRAVSVTDFGRIVLAPLAWF